MHKPVNVRIHGLFVLIGLLLFPVGVALLIIRYALHAKYNHLREKDYRLTGHVLMTLLGLCMLLFLASGATGDVFVGIFIPFFILFGIPAIFFYVIAYSRKKKIIALYKAYYWLIIEQGNGTIVALSQSTGVSVKKVREDIRYMIATGQLPNASLTDSGDIVLPGRTMKSEMQMNDSATAQTSAAMEARIEGTSKSVFCSGCGAAVKLHPTQPKECQYCGTVLKDE
ncbi:hypothetical protein NV379_09755 [Paenibacillus sp. N1-5-1-14]|uniref:hypothetical protein n=1 Tax=Paenibacillus radicibacter TaxID=2972488 RepID=UPI002158B7E6|nr:hypothetical protein [Paenibacillus radicibacter]MCR8642944.1 hypothetical protein [Paenibacillus radicibacter]